MLLSHDVPPAPEGWLAVVLKEPHPKDFQEEVERAENQKQPRHQSGDLKLLQTEVDGFSELAKG